MSTHRRIALICSCALVLIFGLVIGIVVLMDDEMRDRFEIIEAGSPEQRYLDAVRPHLSPDREHDGEAVLSAGVDGVCGVWADPANSRASAIDLLVRTDYSLTEATVIYENAVEFLCPA